jgi:hypothetical protein
MNYQEAKDRRMELIEQIARCADEIAAIDRDLLILQSISLEEDLLRAEEHALTIRGQKPENWNFRYEILR